jgi:hypothetical protein
MLFRNEGGNMTAKEMDTVVEDETAVAVLTARKGHSL